MKPLIKDSLVVVSDIHLLDEQDERGQKLLQLIDSLDPTEVRCFALLGDIFDFCFGASPYFHRKYGRIGLALSNLAAQGVQVVFIQGNHEFSLKELPWEGVDLISGLGTTLTIEGVRIALTHGDLLGAPWHYRWYRGLTRTRVFKWAGLTLPSGFLDRLALGISQKSRKRGMVRQVDHRRIMSAMRRWYQDQACHHGVLGHFHIPYHLKEEAGVILCLESWDKPNYLGFNAGQFVRRYL